MKGVAFTQECYKLLSIFATSPGSRWQRKELQQMTRLPNTTLDRATRRLLAAKILEKKGRLFSLGYGIEDDALFTTVRDEYRRFRSLPFPVYFTLIDVAQVVVDARVEGILFGSYAKLVQKEGSDIDIAILHGKRFEKEAIERAVAKIERRYKIMVELHYFEKGPFLKQKRDPLIKEILKDGKEL